MDGRIDAHEQLVTLYRNASGIAQIVNSQLPDMDLKEIDDARLEPADPRNGARVRQLQGDGELEKAGTAAFTGEVLEHCGQMVEDRIYRRRRRFGFRGLVVRVTRLQHAVQIGRHAAATEQNERQNGKQNDFLGAGLGFGCVDEFLVQGVLARAYVCRSWRVVRSLEGLV